MVSAGNGFTCALLKTGDVYCWGYGNYGDLGTGSLPTTNSGGIATPGKVHLNSTATSVAVGAYNAVCAISGGNTWCWGRGVEGELGNGMFLSSDPYGSSLPVQVMQSSFGSSSIVTGGYYHFCAGNGSVWCWGDDSVGQLGNNMFNDASGYGFNTPQSLYFSYPASVTWRSLADFILPAGGLPQATAASIAGGAGSSGQLGNGSFTSATPYGSAVPVKVTGTLTAPKAISAAGYHACVPAAAVLAIFPLGWKSIRRVGEREHDGQLAVRRRERRPGGRARQPGHRGRRGQQLHLRRSQERVSLVLGHQHLRPARKQQRQRQRVAASDPWLVSGSLTDRTR